MNCKIDDACKEFEKKFNNVKENLKYIKKEDLSKNIFLLHSFALYEEIYFLFKQNKILSIPIVLRSALECFLKLDDIHRNGNDGINRIKISDLKEMLRLISIIKDFDPEYDRNGKQEKNIKDDIGSLENKIKDKNKIFRLTGQAVAYPEENNGFKLSTPLYLLSKHTHCNYSLVKTLHNSRGSNDLFLYPIDNKEMKLEYLNITNLLVSKTIDIYYDIIYSPHTPP